MLLNLFLSVFFVANGFNSNAPELVGQWISSNTIDGIEVEYLIQINDDGTYALDMGKDGTFEIEGQYTVEADEITFVESTGELACPSEAGVYKVAVEDNQLNLEVVADNCQRRVQEGELTWNRM